MPELECGSWMAEMISKIKSCLPASPVKFYPNRVSQKTLGLQEETNGEEYPSWDPRQSWAVMREKYEMADTGREETTHRRVSLLLVLRQGLIYSG